MRKIVKTAKAKVVNLADRRKEVRLEIGVNEAKACIELRMGGTDPCVALTADWAEEIASEIQNFVYELRNGGKLS